ncbi:MAG TPA: HAD family hydrolase [bacterium]|nr:HAD family hydrolase [bacterium]
MSKSPSSHNRFVFLDRDGVINVDHGDYTTSIEEWEWAPGSLEGLKIFTDTGFGVIIITNQACIAKGRQTEEGLARLHSFMLRHIRESGGDILKIYHCPHQTSDGCSCRKPEPGMILKAAKDYKVNLPETFFIGDTARDMETAQRAGARTILIDGEFNVHPVKKPVKAEFYAQDLMEAVKIVIEERGIE